MDTIIKEKLKKIAYSKDVDEAVSHIVRDNHFDIDMEGELYALVCDVITQVTSEKSLASAIKDRLEVSDEIANKVAGEVSEQILDSVNKYIEELKQKSNQAQTPPPKPISQPVLTPPPAPKPVEPPKPTPQPAPQQASAPIPSPAPKVTPPPPATLKAGRGENIPYSQPAPTSPIEKQILEAINTGSVYEGLEKIGKKYDLHLDQLSDLNKNTEAVLLGKLAPDLFVKTIAKDMEIPIDKAKQITMNINSEIIMKVRKNLQQIQTEPEPRTPEAKIVKTTVIEKPEIKESNPNPVINAVEKAGGFTIEKNSEALTSLHSLPNYSNESVISVNEIEKTPVTDISHLLKDHFEDAKEAPVPIGEPLPPKEEPKPTPPPPKPERKPYTADPYRESI
jgi:hypothetical protein